MVKLRGVIPFTKLYTIIYLYKKLQNVTQVPLELCSVKLIKILMLGFKSVLPNELFILSEIPVLSRSGVFFLVLCTFTNQCICQCKDHS